MNSFQNDLLHGLSDDHSARFMALGEHVVLKAGECLFRLGEPADRMFLVLRGCVKLTLPMQIAGGEKDVLIEEKMAGQTLGWSGLIPPHRFTLKGTTALDSELLVFRRSVLLEYFAANPIIGYTITRNVATVIGHRLEIFQTMWLREMQRVVELRYS